MHRTLLLDAHSAGDQLWSPIFHPQLGAFCEDAHFFNRFSGGWIPLNRGRASCSKILVSRPRAFRRIVLSIAVVSLQSFGSQIGAGRLKLPIFCAFAKKVADSFGGRFIDDIDLLVATQQALYALFLDTFAPIFSVL